MGYTPHVLVVGGGAIGVGIARDLAIRGLDVTLVERGPLTAGVTSQTQGLLSSGAHFAQTPKLAQQIALERERLQSIAEHCVESTGGVIVSGDSESAFEETVDAIDTATLEHEVCDGDTLREIAPSLSKDVERGIRVPDTVVDPVALTLATARSAIEYDATLRSHTTVTDITTSGGTIDTVTVEHDPPPARETGPSGPTQSLIEDVDSPRKRVDRPGGPARTPGDTAEDDSTNDGPETEELDPEYIVNAAGASVGQVAGLADIELESSYSGHTLRTVGLSVESVITRVHSAGTATLTPASGLAVVGPAQKQAVEPGESGLSVAAVEQSCDRLTPAVPAVETASTIRTFGCVRSLPSGTDEFADFSLVDHGEIDDCWGMTTVVGGSLTTHRLLAERVADDVCSKFGITRECQTDDIPLPQPDSKDETTDEDQLLCDYCSVTRSEVQSALDDELGRTVDLSEVVARTGATLGQCQGRKCAHLIAAELYAEYDEEVVSDSLDSLCRRRWENQRHALAGEELAQAMQTYRFRVETMNQRPTDLMFVDSESKQLLDAVDDSEDTPTRVDMSAFDDGQPDHTRDRPPWGERPV